MLQLQTKSAPPSSRRSCIALNHLLVSAIFSCVHQTNQHNQTNCHKVEETAWTHKTGPNAPNVFDIFLLKKRERRQHKCFSLKSSSLALTSSKSTPTEYMIHTSTHWESIFWPFSDVHCWYIIILSVWAIEQAHSNLTGKAVVHSKLYSLGFQRNSLKTLVSNTRLHITEYYYLSYTGYTGGEEQSCRGQWQSHSMSFNCLLLQQCYAII